MKTFLGKLKSIIFTNQEEQNHLNPKTSKSSVPRKKRKLSYQSISESGTVTIGTTRWHYQVQRSKKRQRSIGLTIGHEGQICVLAPVRTPRYAIESLVRKQQLWINQKLIDFQKERSRLHGDCGDVSQQILYRGRSLRITYSADQRLPQGCQLEGDTVAINFHEMPKNLNVTNPEVRLELLLWYKKQARSIFGERIRFWSEHLDLRYHRFSISNPRRLWGSCSGHNHIRINWRLIMASQEVLDYVIVHELCHVVHKDHSRRFWNRVEIVLPHFKKTQQELKLLSPILSW